MTDPEDSRGLTLAEAEKDSAFIGNLKTTTPLTDAIVRPYIDCKEINPEEVDALLDHARAQEKEMAALKAANMRLRGVADMQDKLLDGAIADEESVSAQRDALLEALKEIYDSANNGDIPDGRNLHWIVHRAMKALAK